jgi:hypothetical protein
MNLKTCQINYTQAFPQATLEDPVFIRVPQGWHVINGTLHQHENPHFNDWEHYLCLKRNLYGIKQAAHNWFKHLCNGVQNLNFKQSTTDCCLFLCHDCIVIVYVDDCLIFAPKQETIDSVISDLSKTYILQNKGDVSAYLGVQVTKDLRSKTITLTQPGLIEQVIQDVGLDNSAKARTHLWMASCTPIQMDFHGESRGIIDRSLVS